LIGSLLLLVVVFGFIFFVARGCVATQQSTQVRKYVTSADSLLSDSSNAGRGELQNILGNAGGAASKLDDGALSQVANRSDQQYQQALQQEEIPPEFEDAHHYVVTALGIRSQATDDLAQAASGDEEGFEGELATAVANYRTSDTIISDFYVPAVKSSLETAGQTGDQAYLQEPQSFMDYGALGFDAAPASGTTGSAPDALHVVYGIAPLVVALVTEAMRVGAGQRELSGVGDFEALERHEQAVLARRVVRREMGIMAVGALLIVTLALRAAGTGGLF